MNTARSIALRSRETDPKGSASHCPSMAPFCGLGDVKCLAERFAACSGLHLIEHPQPQNGPAHNGSIHS